MSLRRADQRFQLTQDRLHLILACRFGITDRLLQGALDALRRAGAAESGLEVVHVPGAFELPVTARELAETGNYDAIICLGCIIRGQTPHFEYLSTEVSRGISTAAVETRVPLVFGVLTCDTLEQAIDRAGAKHGNLGFQYGLTAVEMGNLFRGIRSRQ